jgi:hypothetical protein
LDTENQLAKAEIAEKYGNPEGIFWLVQKALRRSDNFEWSEIEELNYKTVLAMIENASYITVPVWGRAKMLTYKGITLSTSMGPKTDFEFAVMWGLEKIAKAKITDWSTFEKPTEALVVQLMHTAVAIESDELWNLVNHPKIIATVGLSYILSCLLHLATGKETPLNTFARADKISLFAFEKLLGYAGKFDLEQVTKFIIRQAFIENGKSTLRLLEHPRFLAICSSSGFDVKAYKQNVFAEIMKKYENAQTDPKYKAIYAESDDRKFNSMLNNYYFGDWVGGVIDELDEFNDEDAHYFCEYLLGIEEKFGTGKKDKAMDKELCEYYKTLTDDNTNNKSSFDEAWDETVEINKVLEAEQKEVAEQTAPWDKKIHEDSVAALLDKHGLSKPQPVFDENNEAENIERTEKARDDAMLMQGYRRLQLLSKHFEHEPTQQFRYK